MNGNSRVVQLSLCVIYISFWGEFYKFKVFPFLNKTEDPSQFYAAGVLPKWCLENVECMLKTCSAHAFHIPYPCQQITRLPFKNHFLSLRAVVHLPKIVLSHQGNDGKTLKFYYINSIIFISSRHARSPRHSLKQCLYIFCEKGCVTLL